MTGAESEIQAVVAEMLADAGMTVQRLDVSLSDVEGEADFPGIEVDRRELPIVVGRLTGNVPGPTRMLCAHVDVVPPGDEGTWTSPAFEPTVRDGLMFGRGACDMKGGLVSALESIRLLQAGDSDWAGEVVFLAVPSEEDGGSGAYAALKAGVSADVCVITEPTELEMVVSHGGAITFTLDVPGKAAHASVRREGVSALDNLTYLVEALKQDEIARNQSESRPEMAELGLPYPTIIGQVEGGNWASTVMDRVVAHGRYGVRIGQDCDGAADDLRAAVEAASSEHDFLAEHPPGLSVWGGRFDSSAIDSTHELPDSLRRAAAAIGVREPRAVGAPYGADMRLFINQGNIPTVMYGPGSVKVAHSADEHVPLAEVAECASVLS